ncbi:DNA-formamidopyrimidine glycosylase family protein [Sediminibacterium ginsengisoli]|uniref:Endonuclease-8 n=1 Tax=Sediminibacterium ginsengisoli TaxID=413434 RepID=A0A1T4PZL4_9BACT|nr:DNA-formamidopyrimidine glycosylase family protein [Sediminibacterium ginsengisoli]SJZ96963.1 endonuclease-8 [Sediminibacterium ginsengisoli]
MPEGPSLVILKEKTEKFKGKKVLAVSGTAKADIEKVKNQVVKEIATWGKHYLIRFAKTTIRVHLLMFGTYTINERKEDRQPRLSLKFSNGEMNFYTCAVKMIDEDLDEVYDWSADVMNEKWSSVKTYKKLQEQSNSMICDALLNQEIFSGVGNIIKNEILFRNKIDPRSRVGAIPDKLLKALIRDARTYSFLFLEWKKKFELKAHWQAYHKKECPRDHTPIHKSNTGKGKRQSFYCTTCQKLYN